MSRDTSELTWPERAQRDPSLGAFADAKITRAGLENDTLRYQRAIDRQRIAALLTRLRKREVIKTLRRELGRDRRRLLDGAA